MKTPQHVSPHSSGPRSHLERLSRLAGRTTFVTPGGGGRAVGALVPEDLAHALGCVHDPLAQAVAMAVACQSLLGWPQVRELAHPMLVERLERSLLGMSASAGIQRHRVRMVLRQAFVDVALAQRPRCGRLARELRMRHKDCRLIYRHAAALLEEKAHEGARTACERLRGRDEV